MLTNERKMLPVIANVSQTQFVSRVFTDVKGKQFRLNFVVSIVNGELKGRLVSVQPLSSKTIDIGNDQIFCLPIVCDDKKPNTTYISKHFTLISPYFSQKDILLTSQPTRAPSRK